MNILELKAENFKKLEVVEILAEKNVNIISGKNAQGKSSVLDAIEYCLKGVSKDIPEPIKHGRDKAKISIDLGEITVSRSITPTGSRLVVTPKDGTPIKTPQAVLDKLFNSVSFDPIRFTTLPEKEQIKALLKATGQEEKIEAIDRTRAEAYSWRTEQNRKLKELQARMSSYKDREFPEGEPLNASDVIAEISAINAHNNEIARKKNELTNIGIEGKQIAATIQMNTKEIEALRAKISEMESQNAVLNGRIEELRKSYTSIAHELEGSPEKSTEEAETRLRNLETHNRQVQDRKNCEQLRTEIETVENQVRTLTSKIEELDLQKVEILNSSKIGIPLTIGEDGILFNGIPLKQCSSAEQLKISMAVAMALQPNLKVILIREGSLLDSAGLETIKAFAEKHDYQLWIEKVDESGEIGIVIEEGLIVKSNKKGEK